ncbi:hypothetical protein K490DRAFT_59468 [Saccharata proteae CBS 121410]|uniref:Uncharacterized protein n=1 Tax=Saccharata proteae CBS 121410 TaxID=1314787 RepID=A0A9P4HN21_9PEZI|nr:hypothetical protein K490DRAFT_59468 [Saccharata proteae CBS 121410]
MSYAQLALELPPSIEYLHYPGRCPLPVVCGPCPPTVATAGPSNFTFLAACIDDDHATVFGVKHVRDLMLTPDPLGDLLRSGRLFGEHGDEQLVDPKRYLQVNTTAVDAARKRYKKLLTVWHVDKTWRTGLDTLQHQMATQIITTAWYSLEYDLSREVRTRESSLHVLRMRFPSVYSGSGEAGHVWNRGSEIQDFEGGEEHSNAEDSDTESSDVESSTAEDSYAERGEAGSSTHEGGLARLRSIFS